MSPPRGTAGKSPASSDHDRSAMAHLQVVEQNLVSSATRPLAALFHRTVPGKRHSVLLDPMQFHNALFKGLESDPPLTQQVVMTLATSNDAAPMISAMMSRFAADTTLMAALKDACSTWPSLGSSLISLANRAVAVLNAGAWIKGENEAINALAGWVLHLYRKNRHGFFRKMRMSTEDSLQLCARLLLCIFEDLAYDGNCFKTILSGDLAVPTQLEMRKKLEAQYIFVKTLAEAYQKQLAAQKESYEKEISTCTTSPATPSSRAQHVTNVGDLTKQLAASQTKLNATELELQNTKNQLESTEHNMGKVK
ncbi:uncharacterized protein MYCFIDRAFT_194293 [Pseudocercospora fijiensis CIRAD86]|uniref:Uncharacterized protein n=1 Tax=Pseudocercospora fijiensis (strain CIRAD86) TaxID=383855 RepID=M3BA67_PSEFD|nr:uncharacterized protein MYCFIDRAFT_194293 [Pseudocercospora fijiensis CIRAD86]EME86153.1 hypothetical protein MYCFIDRAFT_194293 [Pseudocercospora fijiensis CIRAD86]